MPTNQLVGAPPSWKNQDSTLIAPTHASGFNYLFSWGLVQFTLILNVSDVEHETETAWAIKEIAGAANYREWVGENDETLHLRGLLFPYRIGGMKQIEVLEGARRGGVANLMIRGDGIPLGWFVCENLHRAHSWLSSEGVGQQIAFEARFVRVPVPASDQAFSQMWSTTGAGG